LNFKEILELIDKVAGSGIGSVEVEQAGTKVRIEGKSLVPQYSTQGGDSRGEGASSGPSAPVFSSPAEVEAARVEAKRVEDAETEAGLHIITSPIVGTFYRSPNPESPSFVSEGDRITKGKVLCIVEAMKLMNEIESDVEGVITRIYPSNGQPVEYGEKLFAVKL
jgi:acetyl-CoA carboxylase biotin carboxyl carrier protein